MYSTQYILVSCILYADDILLLSDSLIKLQLMLNLCFDFGCKSDLVYNAKRSVYFAIGKLFKVASRAEMFMREGEIKLVEICCYLDVGINICNGKYFCTYDAGVWKCKNEQLRKLGVLFNNDAVSVQL